MKNQKLHKPYEALKRELSSRGLTYKDVADIIGVTAPIVQLKIDGQFDFYLPEMHAVCNAFGIDAGVFFAEYGATA